MIRAIPIGWPGFIGKCRSIFLGYSHWSLTGRSGIMESTQRFRKFRSEVKWKGPFRLFLTRIFGITSGGAPRIFRPKFAVPFLTNRFTARFWHLQTAYRRLHTADCRPQTAARRLQTADCTPQTADYKLQSGPQTVDYKTLTEDRWPQILKTTELHPTQILVVLKLRLFGHVLDDMGMCWYCNSQDYYPWWMLIHHRQ